MTRRVLPALAVVLAVALAACSHSASTGGGAAPPSTSGAPDLLVAFGSTSGFGRPDPRLRPDRDSWPQLLFRDSFPLSTVLVNLSDDPTTIAQAVRLELQTALDEHATVAAIWLGPAGEGPCTADTTATRFEPALTSLVKPLRDSGARVIVGNLPDRLPCAVAFNAAVTNVARAQGATVADVASTLASTPTVGPSSPVTIAESRAIAAAFGAAVARS